LAKSIEDSVKAGFLFHRIQRLLSDYRRI